MKLTVEVLRAKLTHLADDTQIVLTTQPDERPGERDISAWDGQNITRLWTFIEGNTTAIDAACEKKLEWADDWSEIVEETK